jgi:streptogramin lyase
VPATEKLELITQLPKELPQRVSDLDYDGEKLWAIIYHGQGRYATFDPVTYGWTASHSNQQHQAIRQVAGIFESPGGLCFANGKLWVAGSYGESFGSIDPATWRVERIFKGKQQQDNNASQTYAGLTFDGTHLWMAWHWFNYRLRASQTQLLLKIDPQTGKVIQQFSLPRGTASDGIHGLTWDGKQLWHLKDHLLAAIDPSNGHVTAQYNLKSLRRPSGLAWDGTALWIAEFEGRIFRLPFEEAN